MIRQEIVSRQDIENKKGATNRQSTDCALSPTWPARHRSRHDPSIRSPTAH